MARVPAPLPLLEAAARRAAEEQARAKAAEALRRKRERTLVKSLQRQLAFQEDERRTAQRVAAEAAARARVWSDPRLDALLAARRAGKPVQQAVTEAERLPPRAAGR